jgi:acyl transferase domain-containing protein
MSDSQDLPVIFLYPGQGSQYFSMCRELYEQHSEFRSHMEECAALTAPYLSQPLLDLLYSQPPSRPFRHTESTTAAILAVEWSLTQLLLTRGVRPVILAGYSLGEFVSAAISGAISLPEAYRLAMALAQTLRSSCQPGAMLAVLAEVDLIHTVSPISTLWEIAGINSPSHFTLSGAPEEIARLHKALRSQEVLSEILDIEFAFHSRRIDCARNSFGGISKDVPLSRPNVACFSCATGQQLEHPTPSHFWDVVRRPVDFRRAVDALEQTGPYTYIDLGPRGTMATWVKQNLNGSRSRTLTAVTPFGGALRSLDRLFAAVG